MWRQLYSCAKTLHSVPFPEPRVLKVYSRISTTGFSSSGRLSEGDSVRGTRSKLLGYEKQPRFEILPWHMKLVYIFMYLLLSFIQQLSQGPQLSDS